MFLYIIILFCVLILLIIQNIVTSGLKDLKPHMLAQGWGNDLGTRTKMSIKVERKLHDMRMLVEDCESAKHVTIRVI